MTASSPRRSPASSATPLRRSCCATRGWDDFAHLFGGIWLPGCGGLEPSGEADVPADLRHRLLGVARRAPGRAGGLRPRDGAGQAAAGRAASAARLARRRDGRRRRRRQRLAARRAAGPAAGPARDRLRPAGDRARRGGARRADRRSSRAASSRACRPATSTSSRRSCTTGTTSARRRSCARSARPRQPDARLLLLDSVVPAGNEPDGAKWLDLLMLALFGGPRAKRGAVAGAARRHAASSRCASRTG